MFRNGFKRNLIVSLLFFLPFIFIGEHLLSSYFSTQNISGLKNNSVVFAQSVRPEETATRTYEQMPNLELANDYISSETGEKAIDNTLISRLVRYHQYVKSRPTIFRLDWKLTLADYLDKNETIQQIRYPGNSTLTENPLQNDRKIIQSLTRNQRNELVNILVSIYNPNYNSSESSSPQNNQQQENLDRDSPPKIKLPTTGGADLLLP